MDLWKTRWMLGLRPGISLYFAVFLFLFIKNVLWLASYSQEEDEGAEVLLVFCFQVWKSAQAFVLKIGSHYKHILRQWNNKVETVEWTKGDKWKSLSPFSNLGGSVVRAPPGFEIRPGFFGAAKKIITIFNSLHVSCCVTFWAHFDNEIWNCLIRSNGENEGMSGDIWTFF